MVDKQRLESKFYNVKDISGILGISETSAYRVIKKLNNELEAQGKIIVTGKVSKRWFDEKAYL